jgi:hypothetical protein
MNAPRSIGWCSANNSRCQIRPRSAPQTWNASDSLVSLESSPVELLTECLFPFTVIRMPRDIFTRAYSALSTLLGKYVVGPYLFRRCSRQPEFTPVQRPQGISWASPDADRSAIPQLDDLKRVAFANNLSAPPIVCSARGKYAYRLQCCERTVNRS